MAFFLEVTKSAGTEGVIATTLTFQEWFGADDGLAAGDYIIVVCSNQTGTATALELTSATGSWTKPDDTDSPRVGSFLRSEIWFHKYDGTTLPTAPTASNGANTAWTGGALVVRCGRGLWPRRMPPRGGASFAQPALRLELLFLLSHICGIVAALCLLVPFMGVLVLWFV